MPRLAFVAVALAATAAATTGCKTDNPNSCELAANAGKPDCTDAGTPVMDKCKSPNDCASTQATPVCDTQKNGGTCVQCIAGDLRACVANATTPRCENDVCVACVDDADCGGTAGVCLLDGSCAAATTIIHATPAGSTDDDCGTLTKPCDLTKAVQVAASPKNIIKLDGDGTYIADNVTISKTVTIDARGATAGGAIIKGSGSNAVLTMTGGTTTIIGGAIQGTTNGNEGVLCSSNSSSVTGVTIVGSKITGHDKQGIKADTCALNITRATISNNSQKTNQHFAGIATQAGTLTISQSFISSNPGGGISVSDGTFTIVGNVLSTNGDSGSTVGGVSIVTSTTGNRLDFNTIVNNQIQTNTIAPGVHCSPSELTARNNIIWGNVGGAISAQISSNCKHDYSDIQQVLLPANDGGHNITPAQDPVFSGGNDFSVQATSPVRGKADPASDLTGIASHDIAGKPRSTSPSDIGAYLVPAQ